MGKKKKLRKLMRKRHLKGVTCVVICGGTSCAPRQLSRELVRQTRAYASERHAPVRVEVAGCLHICKKGPIAATYPEIRFHKRVDATEARALVDALSDRVDDRKR